MEKIKNAAGKTIFQVNLQCRYIEIVHKGCWSRLWFDDIGRLRQHHERIHLQSH